VDDIKHLAHKVSEPLAEYNPPIHRSAVVNF